MVIRVLVQQEPLSMFTDILEFLTSAIHETLVFVHIDKPLDTFNETIILENQIDLHQHLINVKDNLKWRITFGTNMSLSTPIVSSPTAFLLPIRSVSPLDRAMVLTSMFSPTVWSTLFVTMIVFGVLVIIQRRLSAHGRDTFTLWTWFLHFNQQNTITPGSTHTSHLAVAALTSLFTIFTLVLYQNCLLARLLKPQQSETVASMQKIINIINTGEMVLDLKNPEYALYQDIMSSPADDAIQLRASLRKHPPIFTHYAKEYNQTLNIDKPIIVGDQKIFMLANLVREQRCNLEVVEPTDTHIRYLSVGVFDRNRNRTEDLIRQYNQAIGQYSELLQNMANKFYEEKMRWLKRCRQKLTESPQSVSMSVAGTSPISVLSVVGAFMLWLIGCVASGVALAFDDNTTSELEDPPIFCDMPFTTSLNYSMPLTKIQLKTRNPYVSVDAIEFVSPPNQTVCEHCSRWMSYRLYRNPPFQSGEVPFVTLMEENYVDSDVHLDSDMEYSYHVVVVNGSQQGAPSQSLIVSSNSAICGDGRLTGDEQCDDFNTVEGDGCDGACRLELDFNCIGEPSQCYIYDGDGICESFEQETSVVDCGHYTPPGFEDQWVLRATLAKCQDVLCMHECSMAELVGAPTTNELLCRSGIDLNAGWRPCARVDMEDAELQLHFERAVLATAVLVHITSDGFGDFSAQAKRLVLHVVDENNQTHFVQSSKTVSVVCGNKPLMYPILIDMTQPLVYTRQKAIDDCARQQLLYQPHTGQCVQTECMQPACALYTMPNAQVNCTGQGSGDSCAIVCHDGFVLKGSDGGSMRSTLAHLDAMTHINETQPRTSIRRRAWLFCYNTKWIPEDMSCRPIDCLEPIVAHARVNCPNGTTYGVGNTITCDANGVWSVPEAYCQLACASPESLSGQRQSLSRHCRLNYRTIDGTSPHFPVGTKCKFVCGLGQHVQGDSPTSRLYRLSCSAQGDWRGPRCLPITCSKLSFIGLTNCTNGFQYRSECTFKCPSTEKQHVTRCQSDGTWSMDHHDVCSIPNVTCDTPEPNDDFDVTCANETFVGSTCGVSCSVPGYEAVLEHLVTSDRGFAMQHLEPTPQIEFFSDGWCDFQNNRGYCSFDGGDCCPSTVKGGHVRLMFPGLCTAPLCECLDPYAIENRQYDHPASIIEVPVFGVDFGEHDDNYNETDTDDYHRILTFDPTMTGKKQSAKLQSEHLSTLDRLAKRGKRSVFPGYSWYNKLRRVVHKITRVARP